MDGGSVRRKASTYTGQHNTVKRRHTSMPRAGFDPTIPVFALSKTVRVLDRMSIGTGTFIVSCTLKLTSYTRNLNCLVVSSIDTQ
jgi:hypothetical protein